MAESDHEWGWVSMSHIDIMSSGSLKWSEVQFNLINPLVLEIVEHWIRYWFMSSTKLYGIPSLIWWWTKSYQHHDCKGVRDWLIDIFFFVFLENILSSISIAYVSQKLNRACDGSLGPVLQSHGEWLGICILGCWADSSDELPLIQSTVPIDRSIDGSSCDLFDEMINRCCIPTTSVGPGTNDAFGGRQSKRLCLLEEEK